MACAEGHVYLKILVNYMLLPSQFSVIKDTHNLNVNIEFDAVFCFLNFSASAEPCYSLKYCLLCG